PAICTLETSLPRSRSARIRASTLSVLICASAMIRVLKGLANKMRSAGTFPSRISKSQCQFILASKTTWHPAHRRTNVRKSSGRGVNDAASLQVAPLRTEHAIDAVCLLRFLINLARRFSEFHADAHEKSGLR